MFSYVLLCFPMFCYVFAMFSYVLAMFSYVLLCFAIFQPETSPNPPQIVLNTPENPAPKFPEQVAQTTT